jgi:thiosulfate/3-mercaptopyruvate sulfurtransferase
LDWLCPKLGEINNIPPFRKMPFRITLMSRRAAGLLTVAAAVSFLISPAVQAATDKPQTPDLAGTWLISPQVAVDLIKQGALVIDARGADLKRKRSPLPGAVSLEWQDLSEPSKPVKGRPLPVGQATPKLQALGITKDRPVIVLADSVRGWGEDGRVVWLLRHWGHTRAVLVDGGITALEKLGPLSLQPAAAKGDFVAHEQPLLEIKKEEVRSKLSNRDVAFLDVREAREYEGKTPYGESRGGHLPPAKHLFYKDLLDKEGRLLPRDEIEKVLADRGVTRDKEVVSYCTAGIRSGWVTAVLNDLGYKARNYAGSMWEWSAQSAADFPLEK